MDRLRLYSVVKPIVNGRVPNIKRKSLDGATISYACGEAALSSTEDRSDDKRRADAMRTDATVSPL